MKKELEKTKIWNNRKGVDWKSLALKICLSFVEEKGLNSYGSYMGHMVQKWNKKN